MISGKESYLQFFATVTNLRHIVAYLIALLLVLKIFDRNKECVLRHREAQKVMEKIFPI